MKIDVRATDINGISTEFVCQDVKKRKHLDCMVYECISYVGKKEIIRTYVEKNLISIEIKYPEQREKEGDHYE